MPHQCVHCKNVIPVGSKELLEGCKNCGGHFFFYIKDEQLAQIEREVIELPEQEKKVIERDIREMAGITDEDIPVVLDLESIRVVGSGKFEIDLPNLFSRDRPLIYKMEEGKYIIDLASTLKLNTKNLKEIKDPEKKEILSR